MSSQGGAGIGPPLVLIHGVGLDHTMWDSLRESLDRPVITYDLLGHGDAPPLPRGSDLSTLCDQLTQFVQAPVDLVGFSLGALIAQSFTLAHPWLVRRLVLVSGVFNRAAAERAAIVERVEDVRDGGYLANVAHAMDRWFSADFSAAHPHQHDAVLHRLLANDVDSYANAYEIFATADADLARRVQTIACPTLVITGECDARSTPAMAQALAAAVMDGRVEIIPGARHLTPLEAPVLLGAMIEHFLGDTDGF